MSPRSSTLLLLPLVLALGACDRGGTGSEDGGEYRAVLESPNGVEGAAAIELTGPGIQSVTGTAWRFYSQTAGNTTHVVVVHEPAAPIEFRVTMAAGHRPPDARVVEVVSGSDQPRASLDGYRVTFSR